MQAADLEKISAKDFYSDHMRNFYNPIKLGKDLVIITKEDVQMAYMLMKK